MQGDLVLPFFLAVELHYAQDSLTHFCTCLRGSHLGRDRRGVRKQWLAAGPTTRQAGRSDGMEATTSNFVRLEPLFTLQLISPTYIITHHEVLVIFLILTSAVRSTQTSQDSTQGDATFI